MIVLHRLRGEPVYLNADLIEAVEACPDTVVTLVDGRKLVVTEAPEELVDRIRRFRAGVLVAAEEMRRETPRLSVVQDEGEGPPSDVRGHGGHPT